VKSADPDPPVLTESGKVGQDSTPGKGRYATRQTAVLMNISGPIALGNRKEIAELAVKNRLPAIYSLREYVEAGGLMNYGADLTTPTDGRLFMWIRSSRAPSPPISP
jgi:hypothetical protein